MEKTTTGQAGQAGQQPEPELNIKAFKKQFLTFLKITRYSYCTSFKKDFDAAETATELNSVFRRNAGEIAKKLGGRRYSDYCRNCQDLEKQVEELEDRLEGYGNGFLSPEYGTLLFEMKLELIMRNLHKFSYDDLEGFFEPKTLRKTA